jgi:hypothetical protein
VLCPKNSFLDRAKTFRTKEWRGNADWKPLPEDIEYFRKFPQGEVF